MLISYFSFPVTALHKVVEHWNLVNHLNLTIDPCTENATWASGIANPRVACDCTGSTCHITHLKIYALDIIGDLPGELFELKQLIDLNLGQNVLSGRIPPEIGLLSNMQYLSLGVNNLSGPVPSELGNLAKLVELSFSSNQFSGPLPLDLGKLTSLQQLYIDSSGVTGPIPQELSNLKSLQTFWASDNLFTGKLPQFLGTLTELIDLRLEGTLLDGPIPSNFGALTKLDILRIGDLSKEDSSLDFLENLTSLSMLSLRSCRVSGEIPEQIGKFSKLQYLDLRFNKLTGSIPNSFQDFTVLQFLYLGNNYLSGELPTSIVSPQLIALQKSVSGIEYDDDSEILGAASSYKSSRNQWAVSNTGNFLFNSNGPQYIENTDSQITETLESELYKTARISPTSLRYYGLDLKNGKYAVVLHFAELQMEETNSWKGLGRRLFDVYIQGERVVQDLNIQKEAGGSKKALIKTFETNVSNTVMDIHFLWAGKGTCCIPYQGTYGPLISAIHVYQVSDAASSSKSERKRVGRIVGVSFGCAAVVIIMSSVFYLWWIKDDAEPRHVRIHREMRKK
ncbi:putative non-specific serine/threonine protein kinase [Rosa chinensis]|uniref:non-specific serine/threonine protein kinase n=1 Tax=Rosa chinensis TaxID=74649 RepID=A0A2P6PXT2_ROSCH|nr:putative non-specific serine/threonine protein kinase [Rosa chinensis]